MLIYHIRRLIVPIVSEFPSKALWNRKKKADSFASKKKFSNGPAILWIYTPRLFAEFSEKRVENPPADIPGRRCNKQTSAGASEYGRIVLKQVRDVRIKILYSRHDASDIHIAAHITSFLCELLSRKKKKKNRRLTFYTPRTRRSIIQWKVQSVILSQSI